MIPRKRCHPLTIVIDIWNYIKGSFVPFLFLFVLKLDSDFFVWKYGRYAFIIITILAFFGFILNWLTRRYEITDNALHLYAGYIDKEEQVIPFDKIQNTNRKTSVLHRLFHMTSLQLETAMTEENAMITFHALTEHEALRMEQWLTSAADDDGSEDASEMTYMAASGEAEERTIHFTPTKRDTIRAFFSTFSFLAPIFILLSAYVKVNGIFDIEEKAKGAASAVFATWWITVLVILLVLILAVLIGMIRIYLKYGKYEISSDCHRIYIVQGVLNETSFSIAKQNVQAINMQQSFVKRLLGMVEIELIHAGHADDDESDVSSLYPFLKKDRAYTLLKEMLPQYDITEDMTGLTPPALWFDLLRSIPFYLIPAAVLMYFKPAILGITGAWWMIILLLIILVNTGIILSYYNSAYTINASFVQIKKGGFGTDLLVSKRDKIMEVNISQSFLQKKCGVASFGISNRSHPVRQTNIADIPVEAAADFYYWYRHRTADIEMEES